ncbi:MAG: riboflavin synthase [Bacteroidia bacterium]
MFTGIIERLATIQARTQTGTNVTFTLACDFPDAIKIDQSIAHNGACLTVTSVDLQGDTSIYTVTAVQETLDKTNLGDWKVGNKVNIERCLRVGDRLDGHFVQGHVDTIGTVTNIEDKNGSWNYYIEFPTDYANLLVNKGSVTINGTSLTVVEANSHQFWITIIPYTYEHTNFHQLQIGDKVNLEFDILGKYIQKMKGL